MKKVVKKAFMSSLSILGYSVTGNKIIPNSLFYLDKYQLALREMEGLYAERFQHTLTTRENRIELLSELLGTSPSEAFYILYHLSKSLSLEGDICEFGVAQGATSTLMGNEIRDTNKNIWLFDSFQGLPMPTEKDLLKDDIFNLGTINAYAGTMASGLDSVTGRLKAINFPFERAIVVPGFIEETIKLNNLPNKVCFAYVDFDFYEPIKIALHFLDNVLSKSGYVIVDDYDWFSTGAKTAVDEFMEETKGRYTIHIPDKKFGHF